MKIEIKREDDGRWIAEVPDSPGVTVYGKSREEAISKVKALALRVLADRLREVSCPRLSIAGRTSYGRYRLIIVRPQMGPKERNRWAK
jgi:predicted RNase H-like HicB family nuclease